MSYCRFSSDNFQSEVYAYESSQGFIIHVASRRHVGEIPHLPDLLAVSPEEFMRAYHAQMDALRDCKSVPINLPHDGATFICDDLEGMITKLLMLREMGYYVPESALERARAEIGEGEK